MYVLVEMPDPIEERYAVGKVNEVERALRLAFHDEGIKAERITDTYAENLLRGGGC